MFGRGGEEALALEAADVPYEIVPGSPPALAAPALARIPVTHRGLASGFARPVTGHDEAAWRPVVQAVPPGSVTLVILMGLAARAKLKRTARQARLGPPGRRPRSSSAASHRSIRLARHPARLGRARRVPPPGGAPGTPRRGGAVAALARPGSEARRSEQS